MARKGSTVRVRQRALRFLLLRAIYWLLELTFVAPLICPYFVHGPEERVMGWTGFLAVSGVRSLVDPFLGPAIRWAVTSEFVDVRPA
jgi:hypothetical protein